MTTNICALETRNKMISNIVTHVRRSDPLRKILVLSGRKKHLKAIKNLVDDDINHDVMNGTVEEGEIVSCYYIGECTQSQRQDAEENGDIIFGTYEMANEGLDIKHLNTIVLASPKKDVVQAIGRVMRKILQAGDVPPVVLDINDDIDGMRHWLNTRLSEYTYCKYDVQNYFNIDGKYMTHYEYCGNDPSELILHHNDIKIHNTINQSNKNYNLMINDSKRVLNIINNTKRIDTSNDIYYDIIKNNSELQPLKVYADYELTNMNDIFFVKKLTEKDIDTVVVKDVDTDGSLNIDNDIKIGDDEESFNNNNSNGNNKQINYVVNRNNDNHYGFDDITRGKTKNMFLKR
jgi:superfamily II DNA or RNA helicase